MLQSTESGHGQPALDRIEAEMGNAAAIAEPPYAGWDSTKAHSIQLDLFVPQNAEDRKQRAY